MARKITCNNFKISLVVFMPNITTNNAITHTNQLAGRVQMLHCSLLFTVAIPPPRQASLLLSYKI